jgi:hypothetical protein
MYGRATKRWMILLTVFFIGAIHSSAHAAWVRMVKPFPPGMISCADIGEFDGNALLCLAVRCGEGGTIDLLAFQGGDATTFVKFTVGKWTKTYQLLPENQVWNATNWPTAFVSVGRDNELWSRLRSASRIAFATTATSSAGKRISQAGFVRRFDSLLRTCKTPS